MNRFLVFVFFAIAAKARAQTADTILLNGKVLTVDSQFSIREAIAISNGKISAIGETADIRNLTAPRTRVIDLQGRTLRNRLLRQRTSMHRSEVVSTSSLSLCGLHVQAGVRGICGVDYDRTEFSRFRKVFKQVRSLLAPYTRVLPRTPCWTFVSVLIPMFGMGYGSKPCSVE